MNILEAAEICAGRLQITTPTTLVGNSDGNARLLLAMIKQTLVEIADGYIWAELQREGTIPLLTGIDYYSFPADYDRRQSETLWNRDKRWPLIGPLNAQEWQQFKSGLISTQPRQRFRVKGYGEGTRMYIDPVPASSENGQVIAFEYISTNVVKPRTWVASTSWLGLTYCSYDSRIYTRGSSGAATTGTTPPTHLTGTVSDGLINWTRIDTDSTFVYSSIQFDTDELVLDEYSVIDGAVWRFKRERNLEYAELRQDAERGLEIAEIKQIDAGVISLRPSLAGTPMIGPWSYPEEDFGI